MRALIALIFIFLAGGFIAYDQFNLEYWLMAPEKRAEKKWKHEIDNITAKSKDMKKAFMLLKDIEMTTTDQQFKDIIDRTKKPFKKSQNGDYVLKLQIMPFVETDTMKYGYLIQHELFDGANNKISEFNLDINIGYLW